MEEHFFGRPSTSKVGTELTKVGTELQEVEVQEHPQDIPLKFWTPAE